METVVVRACRWQVLPWGASAIGRFARVDACLCDDHFVGALRLMSLTPLVDVLGQDPAVRRILELTATPGSEPFYDVTVAAGARPAVTAAALAEEADILLSMVPNAMGALPSLSVA